MINATADWILQLAIDSLRRRWRTGSERYDKIYSAKNKLSKHFLPSCLLWRNEMERAEFHKQGSNDKKTISWVGFCNLKPRSAYLTSSSASAL